MAASIGPDDGGGVRAKVEALQGLTIDELRQAWPRHVGSVAPPLRSRDLLRRSLAEAIQKEAYGVDGELDRRLAALVRAYQRGDVIQPSRAKYKAGTVLIREHAGVTHRVEVLADGFDWNGQRHKSLSAIATAIAGVRWNGPRFFGLREAAG